jgi:hypothetical protein
LITTQERLCWYYHLQIPKPPHLPGRDGRLECRRSTKLRGRTNFNSHTPLPHLHFTFTTLPHVIMAERPPDPERITHNFDKSDSVTLIVGADKHEVLAHITYITRQSNFSKTALQKDSPEGQTRTIQLLDGIHTTWRPISTTSTPTNFLSATRRKRRQCGIRTGTYDI